MMKCSKYFLGILFSLLLLPRANATRPYHSLGDIFENQLAGLEKEAKSDRSPYLGGQDFTHCCLLAVNESLEIVDHELHFRPGQTHLRGNVSDFLQYQFPCTARYNGSQGSQPQVWITYTWCSENCP